MKTTMIGWASIRMHVGTLFDYKRRKAAVKEPETVEWLRDQHRRHGPYTLLDVGANVGGYSLIACRIDDACCAVAVEPFPPTFATLSRNVALNALGARILAVNAFVASSSGGCMPLRFDGWVSGIAEHAATGSQMLRIPTVDGTALRPLLVGNNVWLCKVDVDGGEADVLEALQPVLGDARLRSVLVECDARTQPDVERLLRSHGFEPESSHGKANQRQFNLIAHRGGMGTAAAGTLPQAAPVAAT